MYALVMLDHRDDSLDLSAAATQRLNPLRDPGIIPGATQPGAIDSGQRGKNERGVVPGARSDQECAASPTTNSPRKRMTKQNLPEKRLPAANTKS
jgi:hypothetical protein